MRLLLDSPVLSTLALKRLHEAIMNEQIPVTIAEQETNYQRITRITRDAALLEGRQEGRQEGQRDLVLRLLTHKLGALDEALRVRVASLEPETLLRLSDALFDFVTQVDLSTWLAALPDPRGVA